MPQLSGSGVGIKRCTTRSCAPFPLCAFLSKVYKPSQLRLWTLHVIVGSISTAGLVFSKHESLFKIDILIVLQFTQDITKQQVIHKEHKESCKKFYSWYLVGWTRVHAPQSVKQLADLTSFPRVILCKAL